MKVFFNLVLFLGALTVARGFAADDHKPLNAVGTQSILNLTAGLTRDYENSFYPSLYQMMVELEDRSTLTPMTLKRLSATANKLLTEQTAFRQRLARWREDPGLSEEIQRRVLTEEVAYIDRIQRLEKVIAKIHQEERRFAQEEKESQGEIEKIEKSGTDALFDSRNSASNKKSLKSLEGSAGEKSMEEIWKSLINKKFNQF